MSSGSAARAPWTRRPGATHITWRWLTPFPKARVGHAERTTIDSLGLETDEAFGYWFDFGDDWWHQIDVVEIAEAAPRDRFPKVTGRVGASPPQYVDWDELED